MALTQSNDTVPELAKLLANRIRWEMEHTVEGYPRPTGVKQERHPVIRPAGKQPQTESTAPSSPPISHKTDMTRTPPASSSIEQPLQSPRDDTHQARPLDTPSTDLMSAAPGSTAEDKGAALEALRSAIGECTRCVLHAGRTHLVFGEGSPQARVVFVGEGPGRDEDAAGRPFVGAAGQLLDRIIIAMGMTRESVYICNVVKCRPPGNRTPEPTERRICGPFVKRQLAVIEPKAVVALGATAAAYLLDTETPISRLRGRFHIKDNLKIMPTYHPAFLLRNPGAKRDVWNDMQQVMGVLGIQKENG